MSRAGPGHGGDGDRWGRGWWAPFPESCAVGRGVLHCSSSRHGEGGRHARVYETHGSKAHRAEPRELGQIRVPDAAFISTAPGPGPALGFHSGLCCLLQSSPIFQSCPSPHRPACCCGAAEAALSLELNPRMCHPSRCFSAAQAWPRHGGRRPTRTAPAAERGASQQAARGPAWKGTAPGRVRSPRERAALFCAPLLPLPPFARVPRGCCKPRDFLHADWRGGGTAGSSICRKAGMCSPGSCSALPPSFVIRGNSFSSRATQGCLDTGVPGYWDASVWAMGAPLLSGCTTESAGCARPPPAALGPSPHPRLHCSAPRAQIYPVLQIMNSFPPTARGRAGRWPRSRARPCTCGRCSHRTLLWRTLLPSFAPEARAQRGKGLSCSLALHFSISRPDPF